MNPKTPGPAPAHVAGYWRRHSAALTRWLHIYLSMVSFGALLFFAITGLTLNHTDWLFGSRPTTSQRPGELELAWVKAPDAAVAKLEIVEHLRRAHAVKGALTDFRLEEAQCVVSFKGPGCSADAFINRETGAYELTEGRLGFVAVINDLHKGRDTGRAWSLLIDVSAVLMTLVSATGLTLICFLKRRRRTGLMAAGVAALLCYLLYLWLVP